MNIDEMQARIVTNADDNEELVGIYLKLIDLSNSINVLKSTILHYVETNLRREDKTWDEIDEASFGITDPKPKAKIDEKAWDTAMTESMELTKLQVEYDRARAPFLTDATQEPRPYIRRKGSAHE